MEGVRKHRKTAGLKKIELRLYIFLVLYIVHVHVYTTCHEAIKYGTCIKY